MRAATTANVASAMATVCTLYYKSPSRRLPSAHVRTTAMIRLILSALAWAGHDAAGYKQVPDTVRVYSSTLSRPRRARRALHHKTG